MLEYILIGCSTSITLSHNFMVWLISLKSPTYLLSFVHRYYSAYPVFLQLLGILTNSNHASPFDPIKIFVTSSVELESSSHTFNLPHVTLVLTWFWLPRASHIAMFFSLLHYFLLKLNTFFCLLWCDFSSLFHWVVFFFTNIPTFASSKLSLVTDAIFLFVQIEYASS